MANSSEKDLLKKINEAKELVTIGERYSHFKNSNNTYKVIDIVIFEATEEPLVIYQAEYSDTDLTFARAISSWTEQVEKDGQKVARFTPVNMI